MSKTDISNNKEKNSEVDQILKTLKKEQPDAKKDGFSNNTSLWIDDPGVFFNKNTLFELWPNENMTRTQKINAISRLVIYMTFIGVFLFRSVKILITGIVTLGVLVVVYYVLIKKNNDFAKQKMKEGFSDESMYQKVKHNFTSPNTPNPAMNILLPEIYDNPQRLVAAPLYNKAVEKEFNESVQNIVKKNFNDDKIDEKLFKETGDKFEFEQSMRQFYTTANTMVPNSQKDFAQFCYGNMASCKDGDVEMCLKATANHLNI